ncbi:MAG: hypothetical protein J6K88_04630 [Oscillospiraceae bacterium]|nr:hypothetical protein [Oscillospiraceae bacterium]
MIKLIVGRKGSGKTKQLIDQMNAVVKKEHGSVVCVEKGLKLTFDIPHSIRLVDVEHYAVEGYEAFYGFIAGILAGNYDITDVFIDSILKIGNADLEALGCFLDKIEKLDTEANLTLTVSADASELPESVKKYM